MPSFYLPSMQRHLPPTPPDFIHYPLGAPNLPPVQDGYLYDVGGYGYSYDIFEGSEVRKMVELRKKYGPSHEMVADTSAFYPYGPVARRPQEPAPAPTGVPVLPPIHIPGAQRRSNSKPVAAPPKEEKVSGGVATHLDYEMEQMVDFVAEMAKGIVQPSATVSTSFRNYVSQILTSTRLPSSTIMCAMHYLATRMTILSDRGVHSTPSSQMYHLLTVALMLASKFLDDNTFQNRSWAEVSHIPVTELNKNEVDWLADIHWDLHVDVADPQGLFGWIKRWEAYKAKKMEISLEALKLTPVDASLRMQYQPHKYTPPTPVYTPSFEAPYPMSAKDTTGIWQPWSNNRALSPPSANPSGPTTPDWFFKPSAGYPHPSAAWGPAPLPPFSTIRTSAPSPYYPSGYNQHYMSNWGPHGPGCGCVQCAPRYDGYGGPLGLQTVMG